MIDVHVHLNWIFGSDGKYGSANRDTADYQIDAELENARKTLAGRLHDDPVARRGERRAAARSDQGRRRRRAAHPHVGLDRSRAAPRRPISSASACARPRQQGADLIKFFASGSIRDGGKMNVTQEQVDAVCGEAKAQGLRTIVHAHDPQSILASVKAGCTEIEHGLFADDASIKAMKDANVYFDPNIGLVLQNYLENKDKFMGSGNFNDEGFASMQKRAAQRARSRSRRRSPPASRCRWAPTPSPARTARTRARSSRASPPARSRWTRSSARPRSRPQSMNLGDTIGTLAPGFEADIVAVAGNPLTDISTLRSVQLRDEGWEGVQEMSRTTRRSVEVM